MRVVAKAAIAAALQRIDPVPLIESGFVAYSNGDAVIPPVGELIVDDPRSRGEVHIKYGYIRGGDYYVIKVASGFAVNADRGLPTGDGLVLLFELATGRPVAVLSDGGHLTDVRTAVAGAIAARRLASPALDCIGVLGTGVQARLQVRYLETWTDCRTLCVWGRRAERVERYRADMADAGFDVVVAARAAEVAERSRLIVTATAATEPLLFAGELRPGTHVSAMGSDTAEKQELDPRLLADADIVVADSRSQCRVRGEIAHALEAGVLDEASVVEIGEVIAGRASGRSDDRQVTIFDSTGVAVQDLQIATAVARECGCV